MNGFAMKNMSHLIFNARHIDFHRFRVEIYKLVTIFSGRKKTHTITWKQLASACLFLNGHRAINADVHIFDRIHFDMHSMLMHCAI